ncbi:MAG: DUF3426 domain-containing protein [Woeseiaceae bacterium]|nr:DUF3426 domain-containing protein [Woeseiaceae bacterium]
MYTQCPECATAFRVTADILKQAGGKVRCGGCSKAFNALAYLSETKPAASPPDDEDKELPELSPDSLEVDDSDVLPLAISDEQSEELLKTLDELAGDDIRLEDTGIEWRLLSDDDEDDSESDGDSGERKALEALQLSDDIDTPIDAELTADVGAPLIDEHLDNSPTHVDEILSVTPNEVEAAEVFDDLEDQVDTTADTSGEHMAENLRFDDNTGLPDGDAGDGASSFTDTAMPHEFEPVAQFVEPNEHIETQVDIVFGEPDEWGELLDEVAVTDEDDADNDDETEVEIDSDDVAEVEDADNDDSADDAATGDTGLSVEDELEAVDDEPESDVEIVEDELDAIDSDLDLIDDELDALDTKPGEVDDAIQNTDNDELTDQSATDDDDLSDQILSELKDRVAVDDASNIAEPVILPETEEEQTINRMIDQDMLRLAVEDDDGTASTMLLQENDEAEEKVSNTGIDIPGFPSEDSNVETIIMEGEFVRTALEQEALEAAAARTDKPEIKNFMEAAKQTFRGKMKQLEEVDENEPKTRFRMVAGIGLLALLLAGQVVHQTRAELVTIPVLNSVITPIYRAIGLPITPEWDVTGWRFEVTKGNTSGGETVAIPTADGEAPAASTDAELLTIISRIGNKSAQALPYPLISVSLTDRFEETIGSKVLTPAEYLGPNIDASRLVPTGTNFNAVIPIESPSGAATGFKLNVCYRQSAGDLRCAVEDFK